MNSQKNLHFRALLSNLQHRTSDCQVRGAAKTPYTAANIVSTVEPSIALNTKISQQSRLGLPTKKGTQREMHRPRTPSHEHANDDKRAQCLRAQPSFWSISTKMRASRAQRQPKGTQREEKNTKKICEIVPKATED